MCCYVKYVVTADAPILEYFLPSPFLVFGFQIVEETLNGEGFCSLGDVWR